MKQQIISFLLTPLFTGLLYLLDGIIFIFICCQVLFIWITNSFKRVGRIDFTSMYEVDGLIKYLVRFELLRDPLIRAIIHHKNTYIIIALLQILKDLGKDSYYVDIMSLKDTYLNAYLAQSHEGTPFEVLNSIKLAHPDAIKHKNYSKSASVILKEIRK